VISRFEQSVPLVRVQNVAFTWHWAIGGYVRLSSAGGPLGFERLGPFSRPAARQLADAVTELIRSNYGDGVSSGFTPVGLSAAGELERLSALQQAGVLTEEEFQAEKAKILSR
jgi:hypothetical protein